MNTPAHLLIGAAAFARLCTQWAARHVPPMGGSMTHIERIHTPEMVKAMERAFAAGLMAAAKNIETNDLKLLGMTPGQYRKRGGR